MSGARNPLIKCNPFYRDSDFLVHRAARKKIFYEPRTLSLEEAKRFVMPYGQYMGYYLAAIQKHQPRYVTWLWKQLKDVNRESAYDGGVTITSVIRVLRGGTDDQIRRTTEGALDNLGGADRARD